MCKLIDQIDHRIKPRYLNSFRMQLRWCRSLNTVRNITMSLSKYRVTMVVTWYDHTGDRVFAYSCPGVFTDLTQTEYALQPQDLL